MLKRLYAYVLFSSDCDQSNESPCSLCQERSRDVGGPSEAAGWSIDTTLHRSALQGAHQQQGAQQNLGALQHQLTKPYRWLGGLNDK